MQVFKINKWGIMALIIELKVVPKARASKIIQDKSGLFVVHVKSPAEDGKANKELIKLLSQLLKVPQVDIEIMQGLTSRKKKIKITGSLTLEQLMHKLGFYEQSSIFK